MYITQDDMVAYFGLDEMLKLTDREGSGQIDATVVALALADAANVINGYARAADYAVPFNPVPDGVARWQADIARFLLYRTELPQGSLVLVNYQTALSQLKSLVKSEFTLQVAGEFSPAPADQVDAQIIVPERMFTGHSMKDY